VTDAKSSGCNHLIKNNKAVLLTEAKELIELMNWEESANSKKGKKRQREIFIELNGNEKIIVDILKEKDTVHIDELNFKSSLSSSAVAAAILNLELQNVVVSLPGKIYQLA
jgi:DNA processing protein